MIPGAALRLPRVLRFKDPGSSTCGTFKVKDPKKKFLHSHEQDGGADVRVRGQAL